MEPLALSIFKDFLQFLLGIIRAYWPFILLIFAGIYYAREKLHTRRYFFVRHGMTVLNEQHIRQSSQGLLTPQGRTQADSAGKALVRFEIEKIYASPFERTVETANIINAYLKVDIQYSPLLVERRNPSSIIGKKYEDEEVRKAVDRMDLSYHDDAYRYSDEENFEDLKKRARDSLALLEKAKERDICVVTHGIFLKMVLSYLLFREDLHVAEYTKLSFINPADNGAITVCKYTPWKRPFTRTKGWEITAYNDVTGLKN